MTESTTEPYSLDHVLKHQYASENVLQSYDVLDTGRSKGIWIVFIHGGYFRDPKVDSTALNETIALIERNEAYKRRISGYASINYRLSPHPSYPQSSDTPSNEMNIARWPDQPNDIIAALRHLQSSYPGSKHYILAGHSVGATLTFIAALRCLDSDLAIPQALVGVSGIYDFPRIHESHPAYVAVTSNAMDEACFAEASPALHRPEEYLQALGTGKENAIKVVIAHSKDDGLVPWEQATEMSKIFEHEAFVCVFLELHGAHDEIWQKSELSRVFQDTLDVLRL